MNHELETCDCSRCEYLQEVELFHAEICDECGEVHDNDIEVIA
jgi:hypothetical protein